MIISTTAMIIFLLAFAGLCSWMKWDFFAGIIGLALYAILCYLACISACFFDSIFNWLLKTEENGHAFIYGPGISLMLTIPLAFLAVVTKNVHMAGLWLLPYLLIIAVAIVASIISIVIILPLLTLLMPLAIILGLFIGFETSADIAECILVLWAVISLMAGIKRYMSHRQ